MAAVALGIKPHSGWAVLVAVTGPRDVELVHRARIEVLADGDPKQPWHLAQDAGMDPDAAQALADRVERGALDAARRSLQEATAAVEAAGHAATIGAVIGVPRDVPPAASVLRSHTLLHSAEGELFRSALAEAVADAGLDVVVVEPSAISLAPHADLLATLGKSAGPPWRADHKAAVAAALSALGRGPGRA